jgi:hypothetical protein
MQRKPGRPVIADAPKVESGGQVFTVLAAPVATVPARRKRKLWATRFPYVPTDMKKHESKPAAYRYVTREVDLWRRGALRSKDVVVYVDEQDGRGWQVFERIDLAELAKAGGSDA